MLKIKASMSINILPLLLRLNAGTEKEAASSTSRNFCGLWAPEGSLRTSLTHCSRCGKPKEATTSSPEKSTLNTSFRNSFIPRMLLDSCDKLFLAEIRTGQIRLVGFCLCCENDAPAATIRHIWNNNIIKIFLYVSREGMKRRKKNSIQNRTTRISVSVLEKTSFVVK